MASELSAGVRKNVADQLGAMIETLGAVDREVGETFPIWTIDSTALTASTEHLSDIAINISRATSLVYTGGAPSFAVEARVGDGEEAQVTAVPDETLPNVAVHFRAAFDAIDRDFAAEDGIVRQLEAPEFRLVSLWVRIDNTDWIYPVEAGAADLVPLHRYSWPEFREQLLHSRPLQGLIA